MGWGRWGAMIFFGVEIFFSLPNRSGIFFLSWSPSCRDIFFLQKQVFSRHAVLSEYFFCLCQRQKILFPSNLLTEIFFTKKNNIAPPPLQVKWTVPYLWTKNLSKVNWHTTYWMWKLKTSECRNVAPTFKSYQRTSLKTVWIFGDNI